MQELMTYIEKQSTINTQILEGLIHQQQTTLHNVNMALSQMQKCMQSINSKSPLQQHTISRIDYNKRQQVSHLIEIYPQNKYILNQLGYNSWDYQLELYQDFQALHRDRLFSFYVLLRNSRDGTLMDKQFLRLSLRIYTTEKFPQQVEKNKQGQPILKNNAQISMQHGRGHFKKLVITDVSSHYPQGKLILVVLAHDPTVKPLIINNVLVKAKKLAVHGNDR